MRTFRTATAASAVGIALLLGLTLTGCQSGNADVPKGVPSAVAVVNGAVSNKASSGDSHWSFTVEVENEQAQENAITRLKDDDFRVLGANKADGSTTYALSNEKEKVNVTVLLTRQNKKFLVIYSIVQL